ncbi:hypothetical protein B0H15DRAFT_854980 [Mycena belliarum]|uniref:U6 snRNA phosphodiesterase n=1 Tax=Mycena belliarum TaxID=1033014 RepID=A0AAD6TZ65_9AGAR|nr:hypothetical protein B0H15DRAFT_854980 [Mycena belliae]
MKGELALVSYSSSDESEVDSSSQPPAKKRKLPALSATLSGPVHVDDPSLHQGRIRSTPHVDGQYATHIYASVPLERGSALFKLLRSIIASARTTVPALHDFWSSPKDLEPELHISLSRPIFLRSHQREDMKRAVRSIAAKSAPFTASFAQITQLVNDEGTRIFLALEIGAGHHELACLSNALTPALRAIHQQEYYTSPRFHASIGWSLLGGRTSASQADVDPPSHSPGSIPPDPRNSSVPANHPSITEFPPSLLPTLNQEYASRLTGSTVKSFDVAEICMKIGKDVSRWRLSGT